MSNLEEGSFSPKDFKPNYIKLIPSHGKEIDLQPMMAELQLNQSITSSIMHGKLVVIDAQGLLANFSVSGSDYIGISVDQPSLGRPIERNFRLVKITDRAHNNNAGAKYIIHFCSDEQVTSSSSVISKAYKGKTISTIVQDILTNYIKTDRIAQIQETTGVYDYVITEMRVFEALQWLASRAYNAKPNYAYHFFESRDGFHFVSLQNLFERKPVRKFVYDIKNTNEQPNSSSDVARNRDSIQLFDIIHDFDILRSISEGSFAANLLEINLLNQRYNQIDYSLYVAESQQLLLNKYKTTNDRVLLNAVDSLNKVYVSTPKTANENSNEIDKWIIPNRMHRSLINSYRIKLVVPGDITLRPGDIIDLTVPKFVAADDGVKESDPFRTGKYLIADMIHVFRSTGVLDTIMEVVSDSYSSRLPDISSDMQRLNRK